MSQTNFYFLNDDNNTVLQDIRRACFGPGAVRERYRNALQKHKEFYGKVDVVKVGFRLYRDDNIPLSFEEEDVSTVIKAACQLAGIHGNSVYEACGRWEGASIHDIVRYNRDYDCVTCDARLPADQVMSVLFFVRNYYQNIHHEGGPLCKVMNLDPEWSVLQKMLVSELFDTFVNWKTGEIEGVIPRHNFPENSIISGHFLTKENLKELLHGTKRNFLQGSYKEQLGYYRDDSKFYRQYRNMDLINYLNIDGQGEEGEETLRYFMSRTNCMGATALYAETETVTPLFPQGKVRWTINEFKAFVNEYFQ